MSLCFKNNNVNEIVHLTQHIFIKLDEFIAGKSKPRYILLKARNGMFMRESDSTKQ